MRGRSNANTERAARAAVDAEAAAVDASGGPEYQDPALVRRLLRAKDRMDAASQEDWPVARLASVSGVSEAHFARAFKHSFGVSPSAYAALTR